MKYILIVLFSFIAFFTISSKSWAGELDGKGLECSKLGLYFPNANGDKYHIWKKGQVIINKYYYFSEGKTIIYQISASNSFPKVKIEKIDYSMKYKESSEFISWSFLPKNLDYPIVWEINRKDLTMHEKDKKIHGYFECSVTNTWDEFLNLLNKEVERKQIELDQEIKKNKL